MEPGISPDPTKDVMEKKEAEVNVTETTRPSEEKIAYKIIPVPYYYPVPVDPEWYYENHERLSRQNERLFGYPEPHLEHFRPSFTRREDFFSTGDRYESRHRRSPLRTNRTENTELQEQEGKLRNNLNDDEEKKDSETGSDGGKDEQRKRKRYLMSFPYDQKKKYSENDEEENNVNISVRSPGTQSPNDTENEAKQWRRDLHSPNVIYEGAHRPVIPNNVPYVIVPMKGPTYMPEGARGHRGERHRLPSDATRYRYNRYADDSMEDAEEEEKQVRFHSNGRRARTVFTRKQLMTLNNMFEKHPFVSGERMSELSDQLGLDRKIVKIWFQNKRQYARKKGSLVEREDDYYQSYSHVFSTPTMADKWKNGN